MKANKATVQQTASTIRSLGHPARIQILTLLGKPGTKMTVTEIYRELGLSQPDASRHLGIMKNTGILQCLRNGSSTRYFINDSRALIRCIGACIERHIS